MPLFERIAFHISESLPVRLRGEIDSILDANGAKKVTLDRATHIISNTVEFEGSDALRKGAVCVSPYWVQRTMELGLLQDPKYFSADQNLIFSGIVATSAGIPPGDKEVIAAGIKDGGGQWREGLTRDVNHLFVTNDQSEKYRTAMHFSDRAHIQILLPQWFDQCWNMQMRLPYDLFAFPDPMFLRNNHDLEVYKAQMLVKRDDMGDANKCAMFRSIRLADGSVRSSPGPAAGPSTHNIWGNRAILLSLSLGLDGHRRESVGARIVRAGGTVVVPEEDEDEIDAVERADVLVTRFRVGPAYAKALADGKTIGTLAWLFYVEKTGVVSSPRDQLLHYPVRNRSIQGFADHEITVTNYQGDARDYLKKLIEIMGARFTPTLSGRNTIVIAAYKSGSKTAKADEWSVPVVTHKWLEDCFVEWRNLTPAQKKYLDYAPGINYGTVVGERGVGRIGLEEDPELPPETGNALRVRKGKDAAVPEEAVAHKVKPRKRPESKDESAEGLPATGTSAREAREVEEVENALDLGDDHPHLEDRLDEVQNLPVVSPTKVGPPRGVKKTPRKDSAPRASTTTPKAKPRPKPPSTRATGIDNQDPEPGSLAKPQKEKTVLKKVVLDVDLQTDDEDDSRGKRKAKPMLGKKRALLLEPEEEEEDDEQPAPRRKGKAPLKRKAQVTREDEDEDEDNVPKPNIKPPVHKKARQVSPVRVESDEDEDMGVTNTPPRGKSKPSPKTYQSKSKARLQHPVSESDSDEVSEGPRTKDAAAGKKLGVVDRPTSKASIHGYTPSPGRVVSVDLPDPRSLLISSMRRPQMQDKGSGSGVSPGRTPLGKLPRTTSLRAAAHEAPGSSPKRGRPSARHDSDASRSPTTSLRRSPRQPPGPSRGTTKAGAAKVASTSRSSSPPFFLPPLQRTPSRRSAAALASQKLRDEVMPDVMNYQKERKRGARKDGRRKSSMSTADFEEEEESQSEGDVRGKKRRKVDRDEGPGRKTKKKVTKKRGTEEPDGLDAPFVAHVTEAKKTVPTTDEDVVGPSKRAAQSGARGKARMESTPVEDRSSDEAEQKSSRKPKQIRILCTKIELSDKTKSAVESLGPKFTTKATDCTHLVANSFARTEKFLCGLSNASFVLRPEWLDACAKSEMIVAESGYYLSDPASEAKYNFRIVDALERAGELKQKNDKLLQGRFFHITPSVSIEFNLLKAVLRALGAECSLASTVTVRSLSTTRFLISCPKDVRIWRPHANQGHPIYNHELVLTGALTQYIDWDDEKKRVPGSL